MFNFKKMSTPKKLGLLLLLVLFITAVVFMAKKIAARGSGSGGGGSDPVDAPGTGTPKTYSCPKSGQTSDRASCRADINCMWEYKTDPNVGVCKDRVLGPKVDCPSIVGTDACNTKNGQCIIINKKCTTRPL